MYTKQLDMDTNIESIKKEISGGNIDEAICRLDEYIAEDSASDEAYYLRGNAYQKKGDVRQALNNYLSAIELNPEGPALQAYNMLIKIMDFYNKDMYNH